MNQKVIAAAVLALLCSSSFSYATAKDAAFITDADIASAKFNTNKPQQKIVYLQDFVSDCLLGDECPQQKLEEGELSGKGKFSLCCFLRAGVLFL
jgi:hypothetical protein